MRKFYVILLVLSLVAPVGAKAKLSSDKIKNQAGNIEAILSLCVFDKNALNDIKSKSVGSSISSGVALAASGVGTVASFKAAKLSGKMIETNFDKSNTESTKGGDDKSGAEATQTDTESTKGGEGESSAEATQTEGENKTEQKNDKKSKGIDSQSFEEDNKKLKNYRLGSTIASGVATGANLATVALSATSVTKVASLMDSVDDCQRALSYITLTE